jgi:hypothetical protein
MKLSVRLYFSSNKIAKKHDAYAIFIKKIAWRNLCLLFVDRCYPVIKDGSI